MSWKTFSLRRKATSPSNPAILGAREHGKSFKRGDDKRIMLMTMVKEGKLSVENAMQKAYGMGIASVPYEDLDETTITLAPNPTGEIYNFGVYRYGKNNKAVKCILQVDCQENSLSLVQHGQKQKSYSFIAVRNVDTAEDTTSLFIQFDDATEIEIDAGSYEEKNRIARVLRVVINQVHYGLPINDNFVQRITIKEGLLEKKGRSAAFLMWPRRFVRICKGEIMYFRPGEEQNESLALSIIALKGDTFVKKIDDYGFTLLTDRKEYTFRIYGSKQHELIEKERDDWILAIQEASKPQIEVSRDSVKSPLEQEQYLKTVVRSLNEELEQLGVMLNIIDAPIRASTQVKKVREIVHSLNDEITTGMLSWTIRQAVLKHEQNAGNSQQFVPSDYYNQRYFSHESNEPTNQNGIQRNAYNTQNSHPYSTDETLQYDSNHDCYNSAGQSLTVGSSHSNYYNQSGMLHDGESLRNENYSHLGGPLKQHSQVEQGYNLLNISQMQPMATKSLDRGDFTSQSSRSGNEYSNDTVYTISEEDYAKVNKSKTIDSQPYYNLDRNYFDEGNVPPTLPPKLYEDVEREDLYVKHSFKPKTDIAEKSGDESSNYDDSYLIDSLIPPPPPINDSVPPPPPPPPLPGFMPIPEKDDRIPNSKMKPLFWSKVPAMQISSSAFKDMDDKLDDLNVERLEKLFCLAEQEKTVKVVTEVDGSNNSSKAVKKSLLNPRKAQNFGIFLSGFKLKSGAIEEKLSILDEDVGLSLEQISSLKRFQPTTEEMEMYKSFKGDVTALPEVDQFMMELSKIRQLSSRLDLLLIVRELPDQYNSIKKPIDNLLSACSSLNENDKFPKLIEYILSIGNYLNGGTTRGRAYGFKLGALVKLVDIRSADKKHTLLQYIAEELYEHDPDSLFCFKEMSALLVPIDASIKGLAAEVEIMKKELKSVEKHIKELSSSTNEIFCKSIQDFTIDYEQKLSELQIKCTNINDLSVVLRKKFGESPTSDFQIWLDNVSTFIKQLQRAAEDVQHKQRRWSEKHSKKISNAIPEEVKHATDATIQNESKRPETDYLSIQEDKETYEKVTSHSTTYDDNVYEKVSTLTSAYQAQQQETNKTQTSLNRIPTKVYTLKQATVFEASNHTEFDSDDDDDLSFPTKCGYLEKLSGGKKRNSKWDKRYFEITTSGYLHYFKKKDGKLSDAIYLRGLPVTLDTKNTRVLRIQQNEREWLLRAENDLEILDWYNVIIYYAQMEEIGI